MDKKEIERLCMLNVDNWDCKPKSCPLYRDCTDSLEEDIKNGE